MLTIFLFVVTAVVAMFIYVIAGSKRKPRGIGDGDSDHASENIE